MGTMLTEKRYKFNFTGEKSLGEYLYLGYVAGAYKYTFTNTI